MITAVIGILMLPWRLYNDAAAYIFTWLIGYGALLGPVAGHHDRRLLLCAPRRARC